MPPPRFCHILQAICFVLVLPLLCQCDRAAREPRSTVQVSLQLPWVHQADEATYYLARETGRFEAEGLEVSIRSGGPGIDPVAEVRAGRAQFVSLAAEKLLLARDQGHDLVALAILYQRSPVTFVSLKNLGLVYPQDFIGRRVTFASLEDRAQFMAMLGRLGIPDPQVTVVPYHYDYQGLRDGAVDISGAYATGGVLRLRSQGIDLNVCWPQDYGIRFYGKALVAERAFVEAHPELTRRFVRAVLNGAQTLLREPRQAVAATMQYAHEQDEELQTAMLRESLPLIAPGDTALGAIDPDKLREMNQVLHEQQVVSRPDLWQKSFTLDFLPPGGNP